MKFRHLLFLAATTTALALPSAALAKEGAPADGLTIIRVFSGWRDAASFKHISEYFTGRENTHGEEMLRSQPGQRSGYYYLLRLANPGPAVPVKINLQIVMPASIKPLDHAFAANLRGGETVLNLGLTGADWPGVQTNPVAWKIDVVGTGGQVLATAKSYLWDKSAGP